MNSFVNTISNLIRVHPSGDSLVRVLHQSSTTFRVSLSEETQKLLAITATRDRVQQWQAWQGWIQVLELQILSVKTYQNALALPNRLPLEVLIQTS